MPASRASSGPAKSTSLPSNQILPRVALLDAGDLPHEGGFAGAVVAHDGDVLAFAQLEVGAFQGVHAAIVLGQAFGLQDDLGHRLSPSRARRRCRHWSSTTAPTMIAPFTISW